MAARTKKPSKSSEMVDRQLARYREMRDFQTTAEPRGDLPKKGKPTKSKASGPAQDLSKGLPFVIQKHAATRLHYDFRLGWEGVLKSWAVAKGPSYFPGDKRLAVQVEDHPMEYGGFEGIIPKGQYGGGTVMVWDSGTWEPHEDVDEGLRTGRLKFALHGEKLKGNWTLVRMGGKAAQEKKPNWLLIKEHDQYERTAEDKAITDEAPDSVVTGRDLEQIAASSDHVWNSKGSEHEGLSKGSAAEEKAAPKKGTPGRTPSPVNDRAIVKNAPREKMPEFIAPQLALQAEEAPDSEEWIHELKLDGYRIQVHIESVRRGTRAAKLFTRSGLDWTHRMPAIAKAAEQLPVDSAVIDGEAVVLDERGSSSFAALQTALQEGKRERLTYFAFDLLHLNGHNLRGLPLLDRKEVLAGLFGVLPEDHELRLSEHLTGSGGEIFRKACALGAEGIVSKTGSSKYVPGRSRTWLKLKCVHEQEFVIGGFTPPSKGGAGIGALLLGYYRDGKLIYAGRSGTGFTQKGGRLLRKQLDDVVIKDTPFEAVPPDGRKDARWVKPKLVAQIGFATWTSDMLLRQAAFKGLREDKPAKDTVLEEPHSLSSVTHVGAAGGKAAKVDRKSAPDAGMPAIHLTHPEKVLDTESGLTKRELAAYYFSVSGSLLSHIAGRPLSIVRCPEGVGKPCFFQKHIGQGMPVGVGSVPVRDRKGGPEEQYLVVSSVEGLVGLAQMGVLEIHPWGSLADSLEKPDRITIDLDPDEAISWRTLTASALKVRDLLKKLGLVSFTKTTGGKGLHVVAPIRADHEWPVVKAFAHAVVGRIERDDPELYLTKMTKAARKGRIYLDYLRNDRGATAVAAYSPRARPGAPVAVPLSWAELKSEEKPVFRVTDFDSWKKRLQRDPWAKFEDLRQSLTADALQSLGVAKKG